MADRRGFEGPLFQPKSIAVICREFAYEFIRRLTRGLVCRVANPAAFLALGRLIRRFSITANDLNMFVVRERYREIGIRCLLSFWRFVE